MSNILFLNGFSKGLIRGGKDGFFVYFGEGGKKFRVRPHLFEHNLIYN